MRRRSRVRPLPVIGLLAALAGCRSYEPSPVDLANHRAEFLARTPDSPQVAAFAASLAPGSEPAGPIDTTDGLSCREAELVALVFNAELRLARLRAGVARAGAENAGLWDDPSLSVDVTRIIQSTPDPWKVFSAVELTLPISGRLRIEKQRASLEHAAELARIAQQEWRIRMDVRRAWTRWSALDAQLAAGRDFLVRVDQILNIVDKMEQAGEMARTEARLFRIEKATNAASLRQLEAQAREADLRIRQLLGLAPGAPARFVADGIGPRVPDEDRGASESLPADPASPHNPRLLVAAAEYEVAEKSLELEIRRQYPDLHIGPGYGFEDGQDQVLLGLSLPLPVLNANRRAIAEAEARRELARAGVETTLELLYGDLNSAQVRLEAATNQRRALETEIVPLVDSQYTDARAVARLGEVNTLVLLESLTRQHDAKVQLIDARRDEALALVDVMDLTGPAGAPINPVPEGR